jgi:hypothetical protein
MPLCTDFPLPLFPSLQGRGNNLGDHHLPQGKGRKLQRLSPSSREREKASGIIASPRGNGENFLQDRYIPSGDFFRTIHPAQYIISELYKTAAFVIYF